MARNSSWSRFFAHNRRKYAKLGARNLADLQRMPQQLSRRLEKSFVVKRTDRPFSSIPVDQALESSINRLGKGRNGVSEKFSNQGIESFCQTLIFRTMIYSAINDIVEIETNDNDSHIECQQNRLELDMRDLQVIVTKLNEEKLFRDDKQNLTELFSGKIIHEAIVDDICSSFDRGELELKKFIKEQLIDRTVDIDPKMQTMKTLKLIDTDTYGLNKPKAQKKVGVH
ncbi:unnamed protein product [Didymodactylos carnosus]|uniref:Uncharacterized protein n=1 Tax=Didymodactylos carnosus TaxID=1234261 RepID=A0A814RCG8_9BILA|nr:unnamed protein product [Didymodactylos carnosus]CAF1447424.1 unnamed protein product [Didymodactylos carnosus]CAF3895895.1 unnamed protein product [Didymodactylos carnosus]CAF4242719.1 unnamed protein product [Didymodactylos carnosus]